MSNICFCIPTRYNSSRLHGKMLYKLGDKTCIAKTYQQVLKSRYVNSNGDNVFVLVDNHKVATEITNLGGQIIRHQGECINGTDCISKYLNQIPIQYDIVVNIQGDEPLIDPTNIDHAIKKHLTLGQSAFFTTLHQVDNRLDYVASASSVKVVTDINNNALWYSRSLLPSNKNQQPCKGVEYKLFTGIYVFNRKLLSKYKDLKTTPSQSEEDIEQLKVLEHGYKIKSYPTVAFNEISLNTIEDYHYLVNIIRKSQSPN